MNLNKEHEKHRVAQPPPQPPLVKGDKPHPPGPPVIIPRDAQSQSSTGSRDVEEVRTATCLSPYHGSVAPPHGPLTQPGVPAAPRARGAGRSSVRVSGRGRGHCYKAAPRPVLPWGGRGPRTTAPQRNQGVPPVSQCKFTESQGTAARPRLCTGEPTGLVRVRRPRSPPGVQRRSEPGRGGGGHGDSPRGVAGRACPGGKSYGVGGDAKGPCSPGKSQLPGMAWAAVRAAVWAARAEETG